MPTRIRLQRKGKKGQPFYHLVVADGRAPRDGKFIEKLGTYNPLTDPATIELNFDRALYWLQVGAQPSDTARSILSREGVMLKEHLLRGVKKGALTEDQVEEKFKAWVKERAEKLDQKAKDAELSEKELKKKRMEEERKINETRAEELAKKYAKDNLKAEKAAEEAAEAEATATEEAAAPAAEAPAAEKPAAEAPAEEAPAEEAPAEEAPAEKQPETASEEKEEKKEEEKKEE